MRRIYWFCIICLGVCGVYSCQKHPVPLEANEFRALLLDMHLVDGTLAVNRGINGGNDLKNYAYYNDLFKKYGISRADFDSCMYYYSAQNVLFSEMYDFVIDSLNKRLTAIDKVLDQLKANDSINYFPLAMDTVRLDSVVTVVVDSIVPGLYKFATTVRFDSAVSNRSRRIASFFISEDNKDTLYARSMIIVPDTLKRTYNWSQYVDSVYSRLVIRYMEAIPVADRPRVYKNGRVVKGKTDKLYNLEEFGGKSWDNQLFRPYISRSTEERLKRGLRR